MANNRLAEFRQQLGFTLERLEEETGIASSTLSRIQTGKRDMTVEQAEKLARSMKISAASLLKLDGGGTSQTAPPPSPPGFSEDEIVRYAAVPGAAALSTANENCYLMEVRTDALSNLNIRIGDVVEVDDSHAACSSPAPLAAVYAVYHPPELAHAEWAVALLRQFVPPSKLIANTGTGEHDVLDIRRDDVRIMGVVRRWVSRKPR